MKNRTLLSGQFSFLALITVLACLAACAPPKRGVSAKIKANTDWLPNDFDPKGTILLIAEFPLRGQNSKMQDYMKENYPYKYEFVEPNVIWRPSDTGIYADKKLYKYCIVKAQNTAYLSGSSAGRESGVRTWDFCFYDRSTKHTYPATRMGGSFAMAPFKYMINTIVDKYK